LFTTRYYNLSMVGYWCRSERGWMIG
jgi:hypothetical protein